MYAHDQQSTTGSQHLVAALEVDNCSAPWPVATEHELTPKSFQFARPQSRAANYVFRGHGYSV